MCTYLLREAVPSAVVGAHLPLAREPLRMKKIMRIPSGATGTPLLGGYASAMTIADGNGRCPRLAAAINFCRQWPFRHTFATAIIPGFKIAFLPLRSSVVSSHRSLQYYTQLYLLKGAIFAYTRSPECLTPESALECAGCPQTTPPGLLSAATVQSHAY